MQDTSYPYQFRYSIAFVAILFFGLAAALFAYKAVHNDSGLIINHIIHLSASKATLFYWTLFALAIPFALVAFLGLFGKKRKIVLTDQSITAPKKGLSKEIVTISYQEITTILVKVIQGQHLLKIVTDHQKLTIPASMLPSKIKFQTLVKELEDRILLSRNRQPKDSIK